MGQRFIGAIGPTRRGGATYNRFAVSRQNRGTTLIDLSLGIAVTHHRNVSLSVRTTQCAKRTKIGGTLRVALLV